MITHDKISSLVGFLEIKNFFLISGPFIRNISFIFNDSLPLRRGTSIVLILRSHSFVSDPPLWVPTGNECQRSWWVTVYKTE